MLYLRLTDEVSLLKSVVLVVGSPSLGVFSRDAIAALPVAQTCIGALVVLEGYREGLSIDELLSAFLDAWSCFHEESTALPVSYICCARTLVEVVDDLVDKSISRLREGRD